MRILAALLLAAGMSQFAHAAINFYRIGKTQVYHQTSDSQPVTPSSFYGGIELFTPSPSELTSALVYTTQSVPPREFNLGESTPGRWGYGPGFNSLEAMDAGLPHGETLAYLIEGGTLGSQTAFLDVPAANYFPAEVPYLTDGTFAELSEFDTTAPFTVTWNGFTQVPGTNNSRTFFSIVRASDGESVIGTSVSQSVLSYQLPANALAPSTEYRANLTYSSRLQQNDAGFVTGDSEVLFDLLTDVIFVTAPFLPGDYNRDHAVDAADYTVWRDSLNQTDLSRYSGADGDGDGMISSGDYGVWKSNFGLVGSGSGSPLPEPSQALFIAEGCLLHLSLRRRLTQSKLSTVCGG
jgi:hypothetical protein